MSSPYAQKGSSGGSVYAQKGASSGSVYAGKGGGSAAPAKKGGGGFLHDLAKYSGAELASNLAKDVGSTAVGIGPGLYHLHQAIAAADPSNPRHFGHGNPAKLEALGKGVVKGYADYYGHDVGHHLYTHPLQPLLDALTVATGGAGAVAKVGKVAADAGMISDTSKLARLADRAEITARSPRAIATGKGPTHTDITSSKPLVKAREVARAKVRSSEKMIEKPGGEFAQFGKQIQTQATQHALGRLQEYQPYFKATHRLSADEWSALHIRSYDVHPDDLIAHVWGKDSPAGKIAADPKVRALVLDPSKKLVRAEAEARKLSQAGGELAVRHRMVTAEASAARPALMTKLAEGQRFEKPTPGKLGQPTKGLVARQKHVASLEGRLARSQAGGFRDVKVAQARLTKLEREHNTALDKIAGRLFGHIDRGEVSYRVRENKRAAQQASGVDSLGRASGASGAKATTRGTVTEQMRAEATKRIEQTIAENPNHPLAAKWNARVNEITQLHTALHPDIFEKVNRRSLGNIGKPTDPARHAQLQGALAVAQRDLATAEKAAASRVKPTGFVGGERTVRQIHGNPYYVPDTMEPTKAISPINTSGGKGVTKKLGSEKRNTGALALSGKLHLRSDLLGPEFLRRVKKVKYDEIHNALRRGAVRITPAELEAQYGGKLPKGWEYLPVKPGKIGPVEEPGLKLPPMSRSQSETTMPVHQIVPNPEDLHDSVLAKTGFSTQDQAQALTSNGRYYLVPTRMVKSATGEFTRSSEFTHKFVTQPLKVWRSLVLGLRVGFLTNNLVGNSLMYAVKIGGTGALRDLFMAIRESHGDNVARQVLDSAATPPELRASLYKEFFPEQMQGTFGKTQSPSASALTTATGTVGKGFRAVTSPIPKLTNAVAETGFRKGLIRNTIRRSPEFKKVYSSMPKQTRTFETAAQRVLEGKGGAAYQRYVSKQVNQALGDYLHMSPFERNVLRNAIPFYSWYRAITVTTAHLAVDTPLRANILGQIGQIGRQWSDKQLGDVPSFLEGSIPLGPGKNGTKKVFGTQSINPYATLEQLRRGMTGDVTALGFNPFVTAAADIYAKKKYNGGVGPAQLAGGTLKAMALGLPPSRLAAPPGPSNLYPNRNLATQLWSYTGLPIKEYNPAEAARQKKQGR